MEKRDTYSNKDLKKWNYEKCMSKYADINDNFANFTTLPPTTTTTLATTIVKTKDDDTLLPTIMGGSLGGFVFLCCLIICCLCISKRSEHRRRAEIEEQYKVVATTLTNITDSEDGCPYETLSMLDPTYRGMVELPTRKQKQKLDGVSNGLAIFKRWISVDGDSGGESALVIPDHKRTQPLPAIPEPNGNSTLAKEIDEYTEIGSENIRNHPEYTPKDQLREVFYPDPDGNPYDRLRQSTLMTNCAIDTPNHLVPVRPNANADQNLNKDDYFILEKPERKINVDGDSTAATSPYFVLEKTEKSKDASDRDSNTQNSGTCCDPVEISITVETPGENETNLEPNKNEKLETVELRKSVESTSPIDDSGDINSDAYFVLEKKLEMNQDRLKDRHSSEADPERPASYLEPVRTYVEILPN